LIGLKSYVGGLAMTNRQWLIWELIDMSDEEFANRICGKRNVWWCDDCIDNKISYPYQDCNKKLYEWLKQEHKG
jgi:hypothetical protein